MKIFALVALLTMGSSAFAGDGGYTSYSCMSASGRTMLSVFMDNYTGSDKPYTIRFIIDGQMLEYVSVSNESPNVSYDWDKNVIEAKKSSTTALKVVLKKVKGTQYQATIKSGYLDPRKGTEFEYYISSNNDIVVNCTEYYQSP